MAAGYNPYRTPPFPRRRGVLFWALLASGQITVRKVDRWRSLTEKPDDQFDLA